MTQATLNRAAMSSTSKI